MCKNYKALVSSDSWENLRLFFFLLKEITDFPLTDGEDQIAKIVELLKFSGDQLEREVQSFLNECDFFLRPHTSP